VVIGFIVKRWLKGMRVLVLTFSILATLAIGTGIYAASERAETIRRVVRSSVTVTVEHGDDMQIGSGTVIGSSNGYSFVLTCRHVIDMDGKPVEISAYPYEGKSVPAFVEIDSPEHDLALLAVKATWPVLHIAALEPALYDTVYLVGAPDGEIATASEAMITSLDVMLLKQRFFRVTNGLMMGGISGGTATNTLGELVGVPARASQHTTQQGLLITLSDVTAFARGYVGIAQ
jgi:S1-C subfamily serine protease